ncbi:hypothetical protein P7C71_g6005, partial [Lecanoromycetidae sp. Uapishka_2]
MEVSPLTQQIRPSSFQPKIARLYEDLFKQDDEDVSESDGFWGEFFLLKPDKAELERQLETLTPDDLLHLQHETQQLFVRAVHQMKAGKMPSYEHALDYIQDSDVPELVFKAFLLIGLLANYNKFEYRNPYRLRLEDFVNESAIVKIVQGLGTACSQSRDFYVAIQEDIAEGWTLTNTLAYLSLGLLASTKPPTPALPNIEETLLSFLRFMTTYASSLSVHEPDLPLLIKPFLATLALAVTSGDTFLPDPAAYDDLFYKLVEAGDYLTRFKEAFEPHLAKPDTTDNQTPAPTTAPIDILIQVATHYHDLVEAEKSRGRLGVNASPREVSKVIRQGYESLSLPSMEGLDRWDRFREGDERGMLKRIARIAVDDTKKLLRAA